jgi:hypothetical protein
MVIRSFALTALLSISIKASRIHAWTLAFPWMNTSVSALAAAVVECIENLLDKP